MIMIPEPSSDGAAGPRQHSCHGIQVYEDVGYPLQHQLLLYDGLRTEVRGGKQ